MMTWKANPLPTELDSSGTVGEIVGLGPDVQAITIKLYRLAVGGYELTFEWLQKVDENSIRAVEQHKCLLMFQRWPFGMRASGVSGWKNYYENIGSTGAR